MSKQSPVTVTVAPTTSIPVAPAAAAPPSTVTSAPETPLRLLLPAPAFNIYAGRAQAAGMDVELYLREHLLQTAHVDCRSAGLWLPAPELKRIQKVAGAAVRDPQRMAEKLEALARFKVNELDMTLDADLVNRAKHNYRVRSGKVTVEQFLGTEMVNAARMSVGLMPKR